MKTKVLIVEDELIIAEDMKEKLFDLDYEVIGTACNSSEAFDILLHKIPDVALIDIKLGTNDNGVQLAQKIKESYGVPIIFVTSYSDKITVEQAKTVKPEGYILKPFEKDDLYTSIELAISRNEHIAEKPAKDKVIFRDSIFIKKDYMLIKIKFEELVWIKSDGNYLDLYCKDTKHLVRSTIKDFVEKLPAVDFLQVHKSYCVNVNFITAIDKNSIWLSDIHIPVGRSFLENIRQVLKLEI